MMPVPANKTLQKIEWLTKEQRIAVRRLIARKDKPELYQSVRSWVARCYNDPGYNDRLLCALDEICETCGVEYLWNKKGVVAAYLNTGDTYECTLMYRYDLGRFQVNSWGAQVS